MNYKNTLKLFLICFLPIDLSFAQINAWQTDPSNTTQYQVPQGWTVDVNQEQGVYMWQAKESENDPTAADITVVAMADFPNSNPEIFIEQLKATIQDFEISETKQISQDESHYKAKGKVEGQKIQSNFIFLRDRNTQMLYIASFSAKENSYMSLGGTSVLYTALQRVDPFSSENNADVINPNGDNLDTDVWNMQSVDVQNYLISQAVTPQKQMLLGEWLQAFSYQTGESYQNIVSGEITFGDRGYGHLFTFNADDTYTLTYKYQSTSQGCIYSADIYEEGRFAIEQNQLVLYPNHYQGSYNICGNVSPESNTSVPTRYFELYLDQSGQHLLIKGQALEYSIGFETDMNGVNYIQEGFNKTN